MIEKTRLKNQSLMQHRARILIQLRQKEETGEVLQAIDYDQLSIENQQYQQKIEEKNHELMALKGACAHTILALTTQKVSVHV